MKTGILVLKTKNICFNDLPPTLDGILAGIEFQRTRDFEKSNLVPEIGKTSEGIPLASRGILVSKTAVRNETYYKAPARIFHRDPHFIDFVTNPPRSFKYFHKTDNGKIDTSVRTVHEVDGVGFLMVGDPDAVIEKIMSSPHIGTDRKNYGYVSEARFEETEAPPLFALVASKGDLLRPVPASANIDAEFKHSRYGFWKTPYTPRFASAAGIEAVMVHDSPCTITVPEESRLMNLIG